MPSSKKPRKNTIVGPRKKSGAKFKNPDRTSIRCRYGHFNCVEGPACEKIRERMGNPPAWKPEYNELIIEHFRKPLQEGPYREHFDDHGKAQLIPARVPTFEGFAVLVCGVSPDTLYEWAKEENKDKYLGFSDAFKHAHALQKEFLLANGTSNAGSPSFIQFFLKNNHGMKDTKDLTNDGGKFEPPVVVNPGGPMWAEDEL